MDFCTVGAFIYRGLKDAPACTVPRSEVLGKGVIVKNRATGEKIIVALPLELLNEARSHI